VVSGYAVHVAGLFGYPAEEVTAAYYDGELNSELIDFAELSGNLVNPLGIDAKALSGRKGLAGELKKDSLEHRRLLHICFTVYSLFL